MISHRFPLDNIPMDIASSWQTREDRRVSTPKRAEEAPPLHRDAFGPTAFGPTAQVALRRLTHAVKDRGWSDNGDMVLGIWQELANRRSIAPQVLARTVPRDFLVSNRATVSDVEQLLLDTADAAKRQGR